MSAFKFSLFAAVGAGLASLGIVGATATAFAQTGTPDIVAHLVQQSAQGNAALMCGEVDKYRALVPLTEDFLLMSPFGGTPTRGADLSSERWNSIGRFFRNGTFEQELVEAYASPDMVVLALIERANVEVGGLPAQDWALRVTLVYRREGSEWKLAHRHADPLAGGVSVEEAAVIARGKHKG